MVSKESLEDYLDYNYMYTNKGVLTRAFTLSRWKEGEEVGRCVGKRGYKTIYILGKRYYTHQIVYWLHTGEWPDLIDHIDGDKTNNAPHNLRSSSKVENALNLKACHKDNRSGFLGVTYRKDTGKYSARFRNKNLGCYNSPEEAHEVYVKFKADATTTS